ncbi:hypothetical protein ROLI_021920 [Roseobacter fucihabitans]|uniref:Mutator family transposase n=1 Tax=Roseobacter fucihabitans TaxID=1537242 RepID=A0ABZ2BUV9_9RHOB|nr:transposase [Roseobacter litoralis]MBC6966777.1 Transposase, Mutator family [Roseobacter litoralis]
MTISKELLEELLSGVERPKDFLGDKGLMKEFKERMPGSELTNHLGYEPDTEPSNQQSNRRNGTTRKTLKGNDGAMPIDIPRDRDGSFGPELIPKGQTRIDGMDNKFIGLYAAGLSTRDIRAHLEEVYPTARRDFSTFTFSKLVVVGRRRLPILRGAALCQGICHIRLKFCLSGCSDFRLCAQLVLSRLRSGLSTHLGSLSFEGQGAFAT